MPSSGTPNFNRRGIMKKSILIVLASILLSFPMNLMGAEFETPHEFKSGDTISADMMNEIFDYIKNANKKISPSELIGTWSCLRYTRSDSCKSPPLGTWTVGTDSLYLYNSGTLVMIDDGDNTYSYTTSIPNIFSCEANDSVGLGNWVLKNNILFITFSTNGTAGDPSRNDGSKLIFLKKVSSSKLLMESGDINALFADCDKQNLPPNSPSSLTYALPADNSSSSITLTWTDTTSNQTEAVTGYKVNRKTVDTDNFTTVSTITDNSTRTYADDNVTESGKYWYRVLAYNTNGDGTPSKVVKAEFPDDEAPSGSLKIDNGSAYTTSSSVGLNLSATDNKGVVAYLATESNAPPSTTSSGWTSVTSTKTYSADNVAFTLSSGYGTKLVFVWYKDGKGNQSGYGASIKYKDSTLDEQSPTGSLTIDNATSSTTSTSVTLNMTAKDNVGVVAYMTSESSVPPSPSSSDWVSITSATSYSTNVSFTLSTGYGVKFVYVWLKDAEGNIAGYGASITYSSQ
jgi:hypothetical protein